MRNFCQAAKLRLSLADSEDWAAVFVELRMRFARCYSKGVVSTSHGIDFFDNVLAGPENWTEPGEYGNNFRKLSENL